MFNFRPDNGKDSSGAVSYKLIITALLLPHQNPSTGGRSESLDTIIEESGAKGPARESAIKAARNRPSPSTGAEPEFFRSIQKPEVPDAAFNYSPPDLTPSPISIYHHAFARFKEKMNTPSDALQFTVEELMRAKEFIYVSLDVYNNEEERHAALQDIEFVGLPSLWTRVYIPTATTTVELDGSCYVTVPELSRHRIYVAYLELNNGLGEGGSDPSNQVQLDYVQGVSLPSCDAIRDKSCCPAFLVAVSGRHLEVWGAVTAEKFFFEPLAHTFLGPKPEAMGMERNNMEEGILEVAKVLQALREGVTELKEHYRGIPTSFGSAPGSVSRSEGKSVRGRPAVQRDVDNHAGMFPSWNRFVEGNETRRIRYVRRLTDDYSKPIFLAQMYSDDVITEVVVKFTKRYCKEAHKLLADHGLAPKLFCAEYEGPGSEVRELLDGPGMWIIVMEYISDAEQESEDEPLNPKHKENLQKAVKLLHEKDFVFGDLRHPNILFRGSEVFLVDFDWCGLAGKVRYPVNIRMTGTGWHEDVGPYKFMTKAHDEYRLAELFKPRYE
ncbi:hypothetical protein SCHPADRAFT_893134 [Schizopora paradoxa]|uniref:Protein kinase domain-containing protein n=1 Tax=Schizopora paradoxa TaxID=27342 RepID=A0A0H2RCY1_9AGAM|nr:hypothetical protein SCHPADRAFT_893134 [Schizopora paradoxa]